MKAFIIYIEGHTQSEIYAKKCFESCKENFDASLYPGFTPSTLTKSNFFNIDPIENSRANNFFNFNHKVFLTKKSIFLTALSLWHVCIDLNEPIVILEHDSYCKRKWQDEKFKDVLILNSESCWSQTAFDHVWKTTAKPAINNSVNLLLHSPLKYKFKNVFFDSLIMPGAASYAINPSGAKKLVSTAEKFGWEQNDHFINTFNVNIETVVPEYFTFQLPNLKTSHGI